MERKTGLGEKSPLLPHHGRSSGMVVYQQFLITDLQERMMNIESSSYDDQLNDIRWEAETALSENREQEKDILQLQKHSATQNWRLMEMEWDTYGK